MHHNQGVFESRPHSTQSQLWPSLVPCLLSLERRRRYILHHISYECVSFNLSNIGLSLYLMAVKLVQLAPWKLTKAESHSAVMVLLGLCAK